MSKFHLHRVFGAISISVLISLSCGLTIDFGQTAPTAAPFQLPTGITPATVEIIPTAQPQQQPATEAVIPTLETDSVTTELPSDLTAEVRNYYEMGYLPFQNGKLYVLDDFSRSSLPSKIFDFSRTGQEAQDFALWADIELDSKGSTTYPNYTGCGFAYRVQNNSEGYTAILTNNAVRMGYCKNGMTQCELFGTTFGTGEVNVRNGTKARFLLTINKDVAHVLVDGVLVGQYTLFTTKLLGMGEIYFGAVSDLNGGYWSNCQISNVRVWESIP